MMKLALKRKILKAAMRGRRRDTAFRGTKNYSKFIVINNATRRQWSIMFKILEKNQSATG